MSKSTIRLPRTTTVAQGDRWIVEFSPADREYTLFIDGNSRGIFFRLVDALENKDADLMVLPPLPQVVASPYCFTAYDADGQCLGEYATYEAAHERAWGTAA